MRIFELPWGQILRRSCDVIRGGGILAFIRTVERNLKTILRPYRRWIALYDTLDQTSRQHIESVIVRLPSHPVISIIVPISADDGKWLDGTIRSVQRQLYTYWELCFALDSSVPEAVSANLKSLVGEDNRICFVNIDSASATWADKCNVALKHASGEYITPIDSGDLLAEHALYWVAKEVVAHRDVDLIFSDEDKIRGKVTRFDPWFKSDWNPTLMLSCNAVGRLGVYRRNLVEQVGGFRSGFESAEEYDLVLRCASRSDANRIRHIPCILYHRCNRAKSQWADSRQAGCRAVAEYLATQNIAAKLEDSRIVYGIPTPQPRVSILVATTARPDLLEPCLKSLFKRTSYRNWELILLVNETARQSPEPVAILNDLAKRTNARVVEYPDQPFNYSWVNNLGAAYATGDILCFLNDDTEVITRDWLEQLVARVSLPQVAAAGPMLYYPDGTIQQAGVILGLSGIAGHAYEGEPRGSYGYHGRASLEQDVSCVSAACMAIRAEVFRAHGGFDDAMPLAYNDVDLCLRLRNAGWRIIWTPAAELVHQESASLGRHNVGARAEQYARDVALMRQRWQRSLEFDPFYNCNLSLEQGYKLAFPPRCSDYRKTL